jgi:hypothetical protein
MLRGGDAILTDLSPDSAKPTNRIALHEHDPAKLV